VWNFLPYGLMHVGQKDAALIMCKHKLMIASYLSPILYIQLVPWGLYKELPSNNHTSVRYCISHN